MDTVSNRICWIIQKIQHLQKRDPAEDLSDIFLYAQEEMGEVAESLAVRKGFKNRQLREPLTSECVDVVISILALFYAAGGSIDGLADKLENKILRWEKRLCAE